MSSHDTILLAAGGTAGHMFPASALAEQLKRAGYDVHLATDKRGMAFVGELTPVEIHSVPAATVYTGGILALPFRLLTLTATFIMSLVLILKLQPRVIVGFGGYPSFGPVVAARLLRRKVLVHEQNAVLGRVNRLAARMGSYIATSYANTANMPSSAAERARRTGNPLRPAVLKAAQGGYRFLSPGRPFDLLVFGGSQGASIFADIVPKAIGLLPENQQRRLRIVHQVRKADMRATLDVYSGLGVYAEIRDFFSDLPTRMRRAHLMVARGGASTVAEMTTLGTPSIIVPLPGSLDQDQANNVRELADEGGAILLPQSELTPERLAKEMEQLMLNDQALRDMSDRARRFGEPDAAGRLFRYTDCLANNKPVQIEQSPGEVNA